MTANNTVSESEDNGRTVSESTYDKNDKKAKKE
jgi:hypothetical protein